MTANSPAGRGPLTGITVLDLTLALAGPMCSQRLGEMGADVIKVEAPGGGDFSRRSPMAGISKFEDSLCFVTLNRNKRSIVLDLKSSEGRDALYRMVGQADVVLQNFRPRAAIKLGIDYAALEKVNPRLVYCAISGYGEDGPLKDRPGQDLLLQSFTGMTFNAGRDGDLPHPSPLYLVDVCASHLACEGILAGLVARGRTGRGQEIKISMLNAIMEVQTQELTAFLAADAPATRSKTPAASIWMEPPYGVYACQNGFLALAQGDLAVLADILDLAELAKWKDQRPPQSDSPGLREWRDKIYMAISGSLKRQDAAHWDPVLTARGVWCGVVNDYATFLAHDQTQRALVDINHPLGGSYQTVAPAIQFSDDPSPHLWAAPAYGADSVEILEQMGFGRAEIETLQQGGVVKTAFDRR